MQIEDTIRLKTIVVLPLNPHMKKKKKDCLLVLHKAIVLHSQVEWSHFLYLSYFLPLKYSLNELLLYILHTAVVYH